MQEVSQATFAAEVVNAAQPVLVDFSAPWCGPCRLLTPILEEVAQERTQLKIVKVDVDQNPGLAQQFQVMSMPTLILFKGGKAAGQWVGLRSKPVLLQELDPLIR